MKVAPHLPLNIWVVLKTIVNEKSSWDLSRTNNSTLIYYINKHQTALKTSLNEPLIPISKNYFISGKNIYFFDSLGLTSVYQGAFNLRKIKKRLWAHSSNKGIVILEVQWNKLIKRTIDVDEPDKFLTKVILDNAYYRNKKRIPYYTFVKNGKIGVINKRIYMKLSPIWDTINYEYTAWKGNKPFKFNYSGGTVYFPHKEIAQLEDGYKVYRNEKGEIKLCDARGWFPKKIRKVLIYQSMINKRERHPLILAEDNNYYYTTRQNYGKLESKLSGIVKSIVSQKQHLFIDNQFVGRGYDTIYPNGIFTPLNDYVHSYFPSIRAYSNDSLFIIGNGAKKEIYQKNVPNSKEYLVDEEVYGYTKDYRHYYNNCGGIKYLPSGVWEFKLYKDASITAMALNMASAKEVYTQLEVPKYKNYSRYNTGDRYNNWRERYKDADYKIYNPETGKLSSFTFKGSLEKFDGYLLLKLSTNKYRLVDNSFKDVLPFKSINKVIKHFNRYYITVEKKLYRFNTNNQQLDSLGENIIYYDSLFYAKKAQNKIVLYNYADEKMHQFEEYGLKELKQSSDISHLMCSSCHFTWNGAASQHKAAIEALSHLQKQFLKFLSLAGNFNYQVAQKKPEYVRSRVYPDYQYFQNRMNTYIHSLKPTKSHIKNKRRINDDMDIEDNGFYRHSPTVKVKHRMDYAYLNVGAETTKAYQLKYKLPAKQKIINHSLSSSTTNFLKNGMVAINLEENMSEYGPSVLLELQDSGYTLYSFLDLMDSTKKDSFVAYMKHQVSINSKFWGVTCQDDLKNYTYLTFAQMFRINSHQIVFRKPHKSARITLSYHSFSDYVKPHLKKYFEKNK